MLEGRSLIARCTPGKVSVQVLVADDHPLFRDGLRVMLESVDDVEVLGEAATGEEAVALASSLRPDEALRAIRAVANGEAIFGPGMA